MLIGISGKKGAGKDTLAALLVNKVRGVHRIALADALKRTAMDLYGLSYAQCFGSIEEKETIDPRWGMTPREILQKFGTEVGRSVHPETWTRRLLADAKLATEQGHVWCWMPTAKRWTMLYLDRSRPRHVAVPDVRFPNEAHAICEAGGIVIKVERPHFGTGVFEAHASETSVDAIEPTYIIRNVGDLRAFEQNVFGLIRDLRQDKRL